MPSPSDVPRRAPMPAPRDPERNVERQRARADRWRAKFEALLNLKRMDMNLLDRVHALLLEDDAPAALDVLTARQVSRDEARARRESLRRARVAREAG